MKNTNKTNYNFNFIVLLVNFSLNRYICRGAFEHHLLYEFVWDSCITGKWQRKADFKRDLAHIYFYAGKSVLKTRRRRVNRTIRMCEREERTTTKKNKITYVLSYIAVNELKTFVRDLSEQRANWLWDADGDRK